MIQGKRKIIDEVVAKTTRGVRGEMVFGLLIKRIPINRSYIGIFGRVILEQLRAVINGMLEEFKLWEI